MSEVPTFEQKFTLTSIPEPQKSRPYLSSTYAQKSKQQVLQTQNYDQKTPETVKKRLISQYWLSYKTNIKGAKRLEEKILLHPDITFEDHSFLQSEMFKIKNSVLYGSMGLMGLYFGAVSYFAKNKPKGNRLRFFGFGATVLPVVSTVGLNWAFRARLERICEDEGLVEKYKIKEIMREVQ
jgi:hypothetical protein